MKRTISLALAALLLTLTACAGNRARAPEPNSRTLDTVEIERSSAPNAFMLVQLLRPRWLMQRPAPSTFGEEVPLVVYVNDLKMGGPDKLREVERNAIRAMRYMDGLEASGRFGLNHQNGAILVSLKVGSPAY